LGVMTKLLKKWLRVQNSDWYKRIDVLFLAGAKQLKLMEMMQENEVCNISI